MQSIRYKYFQKFFNEFPSLFTQKRISFKEFILEKHPLIFNIFVAYLFAYRYYQEREITISADDCMDFKELFEHELQGWL